MIYKFFDHLFPIAGGSIGAVGVGINNLTITTVTLTHGTDLALEATILAVVGGIFGYIVKRLMDLLWSYLKNKVKNK